MAQRVPRLHRPGRGPGSGHGPAPGRRHWRQHAGHGDPSGGCHPDRHLPDHQALWSPRRQLQQAQPRARRLAPDPAQAPGGGAPVGDGRLHGGRAGGNPLRRSAAGGPGSALRGRGRAHRGPPLGGRGRRTAGLGLAPSQAPRAAPDTGLPRGGRGLSGHDDDPWRDPRGAGGLLSARGRGGPGAGYPALLLPGGPPGGR